MATRRTRALQLGRVSVTLTALAAVTAIVAGTAVALLGFVFPDLGDEAAAAPVPSEVDRVADLPVLPTILVALALALALVAAALLLTGSRTRAEMLLGVVLVAGPLLVLAGAELVPHAVTPCSAGELPGVCEADGRGGFDHPRTVHPFAHALLGWVPLALLYVWVLQRWWSAVVPRWVPGRSPSEPRDVAASA